MRKPNPRWIVRMYAEGVHRASSQSVVAMFDALESEFGADLKALDADLAAADMTKLAPEFLVGVPRGLFPLRGHLANWRPWVENAKRELARRGLDVAELLQGLG